MYVNRANVPVLDGLRLHPSIEKTQGQIPSLKICRACDCLFSCLVQVVQVVLLMYIYNCQSESCENVCEQKKAQQMLSENHIKQCR